MGKRGEDRKSAGRGKGVEDMREEQGGKMSHIFLLRRCSVS